MNGEVSGSSGSVCLLITLTCSSKAELQGRSSTGSADCM